MRPQKNPQTDQDGRQSPQKKCTLIITTFFRTKRLVFWSPRMATCPRGDPLCRPTASLSHFRPPSLTRSSVSPSNIELFLFASAFVSDGGIFESLPPSRRHFFLAYFRETGSGGGWVIHVGGRSVTSGCRGVFLENVDRGSNVGNSGTVKNDELKSSDCQTQSKPVSWLTVGETFDWTREGHSESQPLMDYD